MVFSGFRSVYQVAKLTAPLHKLWAGGWPTECSANGMAIGPLVNLAGSLVQSLFHNGSSNSAAGNATPFAEILSSLEQVQQTSPAQYRSVTQQISANLQTSAQAATARGNARLAAELGQLSTDFTVASNTGQLPNLQDLANAIASHRPASPAATIIDGTLSSAGIAVR